MEEIKKINKLEKENQKLKNQRKKMKRKKSTLK